MRRIAGTSALLFVFFLMTAGCGGGGTKVVIQQGVYNPAVGAPNLAVYKGKTVYFPSFTNQANNTGIWHYYSADKKYYYEAAPSLQTYFWDCFSKAFTRIGVRVLATPWSPGTESAKELNIVLNSATDEKVVFSVTLVIPGKSSFQKQYTVEAPPAATDDLAELEKRSYRLVDSAFLAMVTDPDFKKEFLKK